MGYKIEFNSYDEILKFINFATELWSWECCKFCLSTQIGATMNIDTRNNNGGYVDFASLKNYINQFYENNGKVNLRVDVKLKCHESFKKSADPNNYYSAFYVNFYSYNDINYINLTYSENGANVIDTPYVTFVAYIRKIYDAWYTYYSESLTY